MLAALLLLLLPASGLQDPLETVRVDLDDGGWTETEVRAAADGTRIPHGAFARFAPDGRTKRIEGEHADGAREGNWRWRDAEGVLRIRGRYQAGLRDGKWTFRDARDVVRAEGTYRAGRRTKTWSFFDAEGREIAEQSGRWEEIVRTDAYGKPLHRGFTLDGVAHGRWTVWWESGAVFLVAELERGRPAGTWRVGNADGSVDPAFPLPSYGAGFAWHDVDVEPPLAWLWSDAARDEALPEALVGDALADLIRFEPLQGDSDALERDLDRVLRDADASGAAKRLLQHPEEVVPLAVQRLGRLHLGKAEDVAAGARLEALVLTPAVGWRIGIGQEADPSAAGNRRAVVGWATVARLVRGNVEFWELERGSEPRPAGTPAAPIAGDLSAILAAEGLAQGAAAPRRAREVDRALADAVAWLVSAQDAGGYWTCAELGDGTCASLGGPRYVVGITGLALLALCGEGNGTTGGEHRDALLSGLRWLLSTQRKDGSFGNTVHERRLLDHAVATWAVCEALRGSGSCILRERADAAVRYLVGARNPYAGWRYSVPPLGDNDTISTGWVVLALAAARRAGLDFEQNVFGGGLNWISEVSDPTSGQIGYEWFASPPARYALNAEFPREKGEGPTAIGLHAKLLVLGPEAEDPERQPQLDRLLRALPVWDAEGFGIDLHYWFHATRAVRLAGGAREKPWTNAIRKALLEHQRKDDDVRGSWDPAGAWGAFLGRQGTTALAALTLQSLAED